MQPYASDIQAVLSHRHDNGADYWATPDGRLLKGSPFTTLESACMLFELGVPVNDPVLWETVNLIFSILRNDGRFQLAPGGIYPCQTIGAFKALCTLGYADDLRLERTIRHLMEIQFPDGGWRCNKFSFGRGPETEFSNPGPTLTALDAFRYTPLLNHSEALDRAALFLLGHWETRAPLGPCHYCIGTLFMQVAYPFAAYNLFYYVYVLSFYEIARKDKRFSEALAVLQSKLVAGQIVVERPNAKLANLSFCKKGQPSGLATERYGEILKNLD